jgi:hypothetical protein
VTPALDVDEFVERGFVRLRGAFPRSVADRCRAILWRATGCDEHDRSTWTQPVVRVPYRADAPFVDAINAPALHVAFDTLVGADRWWPRRDVGTFAVRFPHPDEPGDDGWHIDASFPPPGADVTDTDYLHWRINTRSDGKVLLLLLLFSDTGEDDAPTRLRVGSHRSIAARLPAFGDAGTDVFQLMPLPEGDVVTATGDAGDVYLCHPFLVHAAQANRGGRPRFLAQPPLHGRGVLDPGGDLGSRSAVERAIRFGLERGQI